MSEHRVRTVQLSASGQEAMILPAEFGPGVELAIGGTVQSHVDPDDPTQVRYEYLRRIANVLDAVGAPGAPLRTLHLGAGALTLPRYLQATRPGSEQVVVDLDRELVDFVVGALPLPPGTRLESIVGDARMVALDLLMDGERFDAVVLDIGTGEDGAEHLRGAEFYEELLGLVGVGAGGDGDLEDGGGEAGGPDAVGEAREAGRPGVLLVNIGDDAGLRFLGEQIRALDEAASGTVGGSGAEGGSKAKGGSAAGGAPEGDVALGVWTLADAGMLERREAGNAVLAVGAGLAARPELAAGTGPAGTGQSAAGAASAGPGPAARTGSAVRTRSARPEPSGKGPAGTTELTEATAERLRAAGPHPAAVLNPAESRALADRLTS